jgi:hypothetical protein
MVGRGPVPGITVLSWVAEDERMGTAAQALVDLAGAVIDYEPADEWCRHSRWIVEYAFRGVSGFAAGGHVN